MAGRFEQGPVGILGKTFQHFEQNHLGYAAKQRGGHMQINARDNPQDIIGGEGGQLGQAAGGFGHFFLADRKTIQHDYGWLGQNRIAFTCRHVAYGARTVKPDMQNNRVSVWRVADHFLDLRRTLLTFTSGLAVFSGGRHGMENPPWRRLQT